MNDWLLLKCPNCGNLFRVPLAEGRSDASCSTCGQSVHFDIDGDSTLSDAANEDAESSVAEAADSVEEPLELSALEEPHTREVVDDPPVTRVSVAGTSSEESTGDKRPTFKNLDEAPKKTSSIRGRQSRGKGSRRKKVESSHRPEGMDWESDSERRRSGDKTSMVVMVIVGLAIVTGLALLIIRGGGKSGELSEEDRMEKEAHEKFMAEEARRVADEASIPVEPAGTRRLGWQADFQKNPREALKQLKPVVQSFVDARSWQERLKFVADAERVRPLMESYYRSHDDGPIATRDIFASSTVEVGEIFITGSMVLGNFETRDFVMIRTGDGEWKVDWESFVGYSSQTWEEFVEQRNTEPQLFRLRITPVYPPYFNYNFSDGKEWVCYLLSARNGDKILYGYARQASVVSSQLNEIFVTKGVAAITLKMRFPENAESSNQVEIVEVIGEGWVPTIIRRQ